ncbi:hypothetical protein L484_014744 [Morus notabilis]|uniref:Uncharacterized protein n=1 Tax=Morus notabilis TaxID=981085 RepID=W9R089_9ROSA|nr:hypothetical protein L484_014744 [Morus notabilis]
MAEIFDERVDWKGHPRSERPGINGEVTEKRMAHSKVFIRKKVLEPSSVNTLVLKCFLNISISSFRHLRIGRERGLSGSPLIETKRKSVRDSK